MLIERKQQVIDKLNQLIALAESKLSINLPQISVRFDLRGRAAGQAGRDRQGNYYIRFNVNMMQNDSWDHLYKETVPHELAHIICFFDRKFGYNHDNGWRKICRLLGGQGNRCHSEQTYFAKGNSYEYITTRGHKVIINDRMHQAIQAGREYIYRNNKGLVNNTSPFKLVAVSGVPVQAETPSPRSEPVNKAKIIREHIAKAKSAGADPSSVINWAILSLGISRALAQAFVDGNWDQVPG